MLFTTMRFMLALTMITSTLAMVRGDAQLNARAVSLGPGPQSVTATSTTSTPTPAATVMVFDPVPSQLTACQSAIIGWMYAGTSNSMIIGITDSVDQTVSPPPPAILKAFDSNVDPNALTWTWSSVAVPAGNYQMLARINGTQTASNIFAVVNGTDLSCLNGVATTSSAATTRASSTSTHTSSHSFSSTSAAVAPSASHSTTASSTSGHKSNAGAIAGGVIGGVIVLAGVLIALLICRNRKSTRSRRAVNVGEWIGVNDSQDPFPRGNKKVVSGQTSAASGHRGPTESMGAMLGGIVHDHNSVEDEKLASPSSLPRAAYIADVNPFADNRRRSRTSSLQNQSTNYSRPRAPSIQSIPLVDVQPSSPEPSRSQSRSSMDINDYSRSPSGLSLSPRRSDFPVSVASSNPSELGPGPVAIGRSDSQQSSQVMRRMSRKPVPRYDSVDLEAHSSTVELPSFEFDNSLSDDANVSGAGLVPKGSFGNLKAMQHSLMPDMPPSARVDRVV